MRNQKLSDLQPTPMNRWTSLTVFITHVLCSPPVKMRELSVLVCKTIPRPGDFVLGSISIHSKRLLQQLSLSSALGSPLLESSSQGTCCNIANLKDKMKHPLLSTTSSSSSYYPISLYPLAAKLVTGLSIFAVFNSSLLLYPV